MRRTLFFGTAPIAVPSLQACAALEGIQVSAVVTQPPARRGRGRKLCKSAVHEAAESLGLPVLTPQRFAGAEGDAIMDAHRPEACLVMAYGQIIRQNHLDRALWLNLHGSLLPRWRGCAPIERCIEAGDTETGVQLMVMEAGLDTGPVYAERRCGTAGHDAASLTLRIGELAAELTTAALIPAMDGELTAVPQDDSKSCYAKRILRHEGQIDFTDDAETWARRSAAFDPRLGLRCRLQRGDQTYNLKIWRAEAVDMQATTPGAVLRANQDELIVSCDSGALRVLSLQCDGKKRLDWSQFCSGIAIGESDFFLAFEK